MCNFNGCDVMFYQFRLVVKTALKLLLVFVEYTETNAQHLVKAVNAVDKKRRKLPTAILLDFGDFYVV